MNEKVDVFNYGTMLYVILTGRWYTDDQRNAEAETGEGTLYLPTATSGNHFYQKSGESLLVDLIHRCRAAVPADRPSMVEIIQKIKDQQRQLAETH